MKKGLIFTLLLVSVLALIYSQTTSLNVNNTSTWVDAVGAIRSGGNNKEYTINVTGNITIPVSIENTFGSLTDITITIQGNGTLSPSANGSIFYIGTRQTIIAKDITMRGRNANNSSVVVIRGGTFRMEGRSNVSGNINNATEGGGVYVAGGVFVMQGSASVSGNTGWGGVHLGWGSFTMQDNTLVSGNTDIGVYISGGTFTMQGNASVSGNNSLDQGGGVYIGKGSFVMQDSASVSGNTSRNLGGGVVVSRANLTMQGNASVSGNNTGGTGGGVSILWGSTFVMENTASVRGNIAKSVGGVYLSGSPDVSTFTMRDSSSVSGNTGSDDDIGGVYVDRKGTFTMQGNSSVSDNKGTGVFITGSDFYGVGRFNMAGGIISRNASKSHSGGVYVDMNGTFTKTGGTIYGDDAEQNLRNTVTSGLGFVVSDVNNFNWRNATAGPSMNTDAYGFWLNDGNLVPFPSEFAGNWQRRNFDNTLEITLNAIKSSSSNYLWILQRISGNAYTLKRSDAANTLTITIKHEYRYESYSSVYILQISGDSGSGQDNWNGTWIKQ